MYLTLYYFRAFLVLDDPVGLIWRRSSFMGAIEMHSTHNKKSASTCWHIRSVFPKHGLSREWLSCAVVWALIQWDMADWGGELGAGFISPLLSQQHRERMLLKSSSSSSPLICIFLICTRLCLINLETQQQVSHCSTLYMADIQRDNKVL